MSLTSNDKNPNSLTLHTSSYAMHNTIKQFLEELKVPQSKLERTKYRFSIVILQLCFCCYMLRQKCPLLVLYFGTNVF